MCIRDSLIHWMYRPVASDPLNNVKSFSVTVIKTIIFPAATDARPRTRQLTCLDSLPLNVKIKYAIEIL